MLALLAPVALGLSPNCTCTEFCASTCADTNAGTVTTATIYRLTPLNVTGIEDKNTGTAAGDLGFFLQKDNTRGCVMPRDADKVECFLAYEPVVRAFAVEWDQKWGPFERCNPLPFYHGNGHETEIAHVDTRNWGCFPWHGRGATPWLPGGVLGAGRHSSTSCPNGTYCPDVMNHTVGRDPAMHAAYDPNRRSIGTYFGGHWYSTPTQAQCTGDRKPGDGKSPHCSWRILPGTTTKTVNASCMQQQLVPVVIAHGAACFAALPQPVNTTTSAYFDCISDAVMGCGAPLEHTCRWDSTGKLSIAPILGDLLVAKWTEAFAGGCPLIPAVAVVDRE